MSDDLIRSLGLDDNRTGERVITGTITSVSVDSASVEYHVAGRRRTAILPISEYPRGRSWSVGETHTMLVTPASGRTIVSVVAPELVEAVLSGTAPEVRSGDVRVMAVARRAGMRTKVAVAATVEGVDPVAACVGRASNRVSHLKNALGGEQIDIVAWHDDTETYLRNALQPAGVIDVHLDEEKRAAVVTVPSHQMSAAVGGGGLNSVLAGQLTGLNVRIAAA